jgi:formylglycine-generating enzyme required for sulfatase activity
MSYLKSRFRKIVFYAFLFLSLFVSPLVGTPAVRAQGTIDPVTHNDDWKPQKDVFAGVEMALVPPGCFKMGSTNAQAEQPIHEICFTAPFYIDVLEVSNGQFDDKGGVANRESYHPGDKLPREFITWFEARDFCAEREARLPTEAEWEYAARGPDSLKFTWGNEFISSALIYNTTKPAEVGSVRSGASWVGAEDLIGNVWEWTSSIYKNYPYKAKDGRESLKDKRADRVLRGGSYANFRFTTASIRAFSPPDTVFANYGFRCARDYEAK